MTINQDMQDIDSYPYSSAFGFEDEKNGWWRTAWVGAGSAHIYYFQTKDGGMTWEKIAINISKNIIEFIASLSFSLFPIYHNFF